MMKLQTQKSLLRAIFNYYRSYLKIRFGMKPQTVDDLHAWVYFNLIHLWNAQIPISITLGEFLTGSTESKKGFFKIITSTVFLVRFGVLTWPLLALFLSRQKNLKEWYHNWIINIVRPDLLMAVGKGPYLLSDQITLPSCFLHLIEGEYHFNKSPSEFDIDNKERFCDKAKALGLPVTQNIAPNDVEDNETYIAKPIDSAQGKGIFLAKGVELKNKTNFDGYVIQKIYKNHRDIVNIVGEANGLSTLRVATLQTKNGDFVVLGCFFRMCINGSIVDNLHAGGIVCYVDLNSGLVKTGSTDKIKQQCWTNAFRITHHPDTHQEFANKFTLPFFEEAKALCINAHKKLGPHLMLCSWDVGLTNEGPILIEVSGGMGGSLECMYNLDYPLYLETLLDKINKLDQ